MTNQEANRRTASLVLLSGRIRRFLGAVPHESLEEAARRTVASTPSWSPAHDVAKVILQARRKDPLEDPLPVLERAAQLARPKLVPRRFKKPDR